MERENELGQGNLDNLQGRTPQRSSADYLQMGSYADYAEEVEGDPQPHYFSCLMKVTQEDGKSLPPHLYHGSAIKATCGQLTGSEPMTVTPLTPFEVLLQFRDSVILTSIARQLCKTTTWAGVPVEINCTIGTKDILFKTLLSRGIRPPGPDAGQGSSGFSQEAIQSESRDKQVIQNIEQRVNEWQMTHAPQEQSKGLGGSAPNVAGQDYFTPGHSNYSLPPPQPDFNRPPPQNPIVPSFVPMPTQNVFNHPPPNFSQGSVDPTGQPDLSRNFGPWINPNSQPIIPQLSTSSEAHNAARLWQHQAAQKGTVSMGQGSGYQNPMVMNPAPNPFMAQAPNSLPFQTTAFIPNLQGNFPTGLVDQPPKQCAPWPAYQKIPKAPRLPNFSGDEPTPKHEATFVNWLYQVESYMKNYPEPSMRQAIMQSVRGGAANVVRYVGPEATVQMILSKLKIQFGSVANVDVLLHDFYKITQQRGESVRQFNNKLNDTLNEVRTRFPGVIHESLADQYLKNRLFNGMSVHLKNGIRYLYANPASTAEHLYLAALAVETEFNTRNIRSKVAHLSVADSEDETVEGDSSEEDPEDLITLMAAGAPNFKKKFDKSKKYSKDQKDGNNTAANKDIRNNLKGPQINASGPFRGANAGKTNECYGCNGYGHKRNECPTWLNAQRRRGVESAPPSDQTKVESHSLTSTEPNPDQQ